MLEIDSDLFSKIKRPSSINERKEIGERANPCPTPVSIL